MNVTQTIQNQQLQGKKLLNLLLGKGKVLVTRQHSLIFWQYFLLEQYASSKPHYSVD